MRTTLCILQLRMPIDVLQTKMFLGARCYQPSTYLVFHPNAWLPMLHLSLLPTSITGSPYVARQPRMLGASSLPSDNRTPLSGMPEGQCERPAARSPTMMWCDEQGEMEREKRRLTTGKYTLILSRDEYLDTSRTRQIL